jgi:hypothetical protein
MEYDYDEKIEEMQKYIEWLKEQKEQKKINLKIGKIDLDELSKYITQMKKEGRYFEKGDADYEESLKHPMGIPKNLWHIPNK